MLHADAINDNYTFSLPILVFFIDSFLVHRTAKRIPLTTNIPPTPKPTPIPIILPRDNPPVKIAFYDFSTKNNLFKLYKLLGQEVI